MAKFHSLTRGVYTRNLGLLLDDAGVIESSLQCCVLVAGILVVKCHKPRLTLGVEKDSNLSNIKTKSTIGFLTWTAIAIASCDSKENTGRMENKAEMGGVGASGPA